MGMAPFQSRAQTVTLSGRDESVSEGSALWEEKDNCYRGPFHKGPSINDVTLQGGGGLPNA